MENPNRDETTLKTFNTAKKYAEEILYPMMELYHKYERQSDFGCENLDLSKEIPEEIRDIERFNGLKAMNDMLQSLYKTISSSVRLKGNKKEIEMLDNMINITVKVKYIFYQKRELFFKIIYKELRPSETLDRNYFEKIKEIISTCYINAEILMTRNKLLFADSNDEFSSDREIMDNIKKEYIDG